MPVNQLLKKATDKFIYDPMFNIEDVRTLVFDMGLLAMENPEFLERQDRQDLTYKLKQLHKFLGELEKYRAAAVEADAPPPYEDALLLG